MPTDPSLELSVTEKAVFGADAVRHPITGIPIERGSGALHPKLQARNHLAVIAQQEGAAVAADVRKRLDDFEAGANQGRQSNVVNLMPGGPNGIH
jgi:hypothetical protein